MNKRCLIMAGGTGGHVFPGLAVAKALAARGWDIQWLGTAQRMEAEVVPANGIPIHFIPAKGLRGKGTVAKLVGVMALAQGLFCARGVISKLRPDVVIGFGGYASGPGGLAAWTKGIPLIIHEQNAAAGMTNRLLSRIAKKVLVGFADAKSQFSHAPERCVAVGNPVRKDIVNVPAKVKTHQPLRMLIVGGSLGSRPLNEIVPAACYNLNDLSVWHQTGKGNRPTVKEAWQGSACNVKITEFIDDMAEAYTWADVVICRAGALTVAEVAAAGVAAMFVPLPHAVDDHQTKNAMSLVKQDAAVLVEQSELPARLEKIVASWIAQPEVCLAMSQRAKACAVTDATHNVVSQCEALVGAVE
ncbi:undecaprenyldiphospho-muramoylpentapeptide beta-N-acetylglucosaminyltransferase [Alteromonas pelagimontana]|uniref:UDP-N-acetylglucosamine--N-acetylmuramyl-(pentapeptide) pyrophosphoryl-undecaprenol N-acetylglucosamine transferase n=1 Tax=Alteromonas pelagimontana TaxID=1858656 RepID=A0A6M4MA25_9ALTE|nr:undecaprenyldiphospho-muramoylpentapeptide beta-N-acetylglucosaminyltransferase [Alteromonas pelagimontana]QJR80024.1 undecaprenyldiphospho-muramoylpentapeptide beta-N-acetylglucosaminyltransferase [Alteromonas pelagimontana]